MFTHYFLRIFTDEPSAQREKSFKALIHITKLSSKSVCARAHAHTHKSLLFFHLVFVLTDSTWSKCTKKYYLIKQNAFRKRKNDGLTFGLCAGPWWMRPSGSTGSQSWTSWSPGWCNRHSEHKIWRAHVQREGGLRTSALYKIRIEHEHYKCHFLALTYKFLRMSKRKISCLSSFNISLTRLKVKLY